MLASSCTSGEGWIKAAMEKEVCFKPLSPSKRVVLSPTHVLNLFKSPLSGSWRPCLPLMEQSIRCPSSDVRRAYPETIKNKKILVPDTLLSLPV